MQGPLDGILAQIVRRLREALNPTAIYLYGSCVRGEMNPDGDVDLLVVVKQSDLTFFERGAIAYRALRHIGVPVDVQVYTEEEFKTRADLPVSFERTVRTKGKLLHAA